MTESTPADDPSQAQGAEDVDTEGKKESKEGDEDVTDDEPNKVGPVDEEKVEGKEIDDVGVAKIMEEVESILSKLSDDQDDKLQELLGYHYGKEYEKRDEMMAKLVKEDEDITELLNLVMVLEDHGAAINLLEEEDITELLNLVMVLEDHGA